MLMDSTTSKIQQLQKAFAELESHRAITLNLKWKELEEHFHGLEKSLKRRFHELEDQEKEFETKTRKAREMLLKREAVVVAKEHASLEKLQKKRDAAVFAITTALEKQRKVSSAEPIVSNDCEIRAVTVEDKLMDSMSVGKKRFPLALKAAADPARLVLDSLEGFYHVEVPNVDGKKDSSLLGLRRTCIMLMECLSVLLANLDMVSLSAVISENVKEQAKAIAEEWKPKLDCLDVEDRNGNSLEAHAFLQLLATFGIASDFNEEELSRLIPMVSRRRQTADLCRSLRLSEKMPVSYHEGEFEFGPFDSKKVIHTMLTVISVTAASGPFVLINIINHDRHLSCVEKLYMVFMFTSIISCYLHCSSLFCFVGLITYTGVIEVLVNSGRQIDAVNLAFAFELTEQFSPVPLLKFYLKEARKASSPGKVGNVSPTAETEVSERELTALKAVIKCIEEHNLEEQYPVDPLQKRVVQLEKAKADKKRATEAAKPQPKRPRANGAGYGPRVTNVAADKTFYPTRVTDSFSPSHGNYFGNGYQYQTPYLH
ncbi:hypothetical protein Patl1_03174 [Pistacia atlantica]|uniref:Uncharacterized protein n=1 Tax=Pistacia atlantica TaxID=434234 RepID=A0ACC1C408_9ROSI|nr:hypothetical protein Patl1_03174 [Pistacia atlantica]